ncbi:hypothetical protein D0862_13741 [Hortaea werneckii]|uniref:Copper-fist domain-containing protein n=1 Tax=Hortaea werneckii TaxID=91943 RepID=A0A3M7EIP9_HORWE|nr:hypothetical protein D0862_13741 [Hortaea werneckii]
MHPKKGEKRTVECRCDEQGRYCCFLEPKHWDQLMALQKPTVDFYKTKEDLEASHAAQAPTSFPMTPAFSTRSPRTFSVSSTRSTPGPQNTGPPLQFVPSEYNVRSPSQTITPRFGMMGIGGPQGSEQSVTPDVLAWNTPLPQAAQEYHQSQFAANVRLPEDRGCCQGPTSPPPYQFNSHPHTPGPPQQADFAPFGGMMSNISFPEQPPPQPAQSSSFERFANDYFNHQFPSAICQTCGLAGCTCRMCPPVLQNTVTGSWAQCCGRKHARTKTYVAPTATAAFEEPARYDLPSEPLQQRQPQHQPQQHQLDYTQPPAAQSNIYDPMSHPFTHDAHQNTLSPFDIGPPSLFTSQDPSRQPSLQPPDGLVSPDFSPFDPGEDFGLGDDSTAVENGNTGPLDDLSEFLIQDLDRPPRPPPPPSGPPLQFHSSALGTEREKPTPDSRPVGKQPRAEKRSCCCGGDGNG